jgi:hypothetical protein
VFIGEVENNKSDKNLVAVKHLLRNATEKDKYVTVTTILVYSLQNQCEKY